jgi:hypothetical protein
MLRWVWNEFDYRVNVCRVTQRALQAITPDMLHRDWDEFDYRVDLSFDTSRHCRPLKRKCYAGARMSLITVWMCVV